MIFFWKLLTETYVYSCKNKEKLYQTWKNISADKVTNFLQINKTNIAHKIKKIFSEERVSIIIDMLIRSEKLPEFLIYSLSFFLIIGYHLIDFSNAIIGIYKITKLWK